MSLFTELRRRNVFKVGAAYAIVAWLLLQIVDVVLPTFNAPQWVAQTVTFLLLLGLPITLIMAWAYELTPDGIRPESDSVARGSDAPASGQKLNYVILGLVVLAVGFIAIDQYVLDDEAPITVVEAARGDNEGSFEIVASPVSLGESAEIQRNAFDVGSTIPMGATAAIEAEPTISRDGRRLVFAANLGDGIQLHSRLLADFDSLPVPGTEVSRLPFMSPDGLWVGFGSGMASGLSKVSVLGGRPQTLTDEIGLFYGGSWGDDDTIIFSTSGDGGAYLARISAAGGRPERLTTPEDGTSHRWPEILPGGRDILFTIIGANALASDGSIAILSLETNEYRTLIPNAFNARYAPTGHIIFARENGLWGVPFELEGLGTVGTAVPLIDGIQLNTQSGHAPYGLSDDGALVYVRGGDRSGANGRNLLWIDRSGQEFPLSIGASNYYYPRLSPDGNRLAVTHGDDAASLHVWIYDLERGTQNPLTFEANTNDVYPLWTPDGRSLVYYSAREESGIFRKAADGTGQEERLTSSQALQRPESFSPDGALLIYSQDTSAFAADLHVLSLEGDRVSRPLLNAEFAERVASISPNGRWVAYSSNESGEYRVYVRPFPNVDDGKWQISTGVGWVPRWSADGKELLFRTSQDTIQAAQIQGEDPFLPGPPSVVLSAGIYAVFGASPNFDVAADGQRFLIMRTSEAGEAADDSTSIAIVRNWFEDLRRLAPTAE